MRHQKMPRVSVSKAPVWQLRVRTNRLRVLMRTAAASQVYVGVAADAWRVDVHVFRSATASVGPAQPFTTEANTDLNTGTALHWTRGCNYSPATRMVVWICFWRDDYG